MPARLLKAARQLNRIPEVLRCRQHTPQWLRLSAAYIGLKSALPFEITLPSGKFEFREMSDIATFWQIFYRRIYAVEASDRLIIDAGANIGAFTLYALQAAPKAHVIAIEPAPDSCNRIRAMLRAHNLQSRCTLYQAALAAANGETTIQLDTGSQFRRTGISGTPVRAVALDSLIPSNATVDLLKMDIEGAEYEVLRSAAPQTMRRIRRLMLEYHPNASCRSAIDPLLATGFRLDLHRDDGEGYGMVWLSRATFSAAAAS